MRSLRWHFTNKSVTGAPYSIKSYSLSPSWTLWWRVRCLWLSWANYRFRFRENCHENADTLTLVQIVSCEPVNVAPIWHPVTPTAASVVPYVLRCMRLNTAWGRQSFGAAAITAVQAALKISRPNFKRCAICNFYGVCNRSEQVNCCNQEWLGSRVVSVLDSGAEGPGFKSQSRRCRLTVLGKLSNCSHTSCLCSPSSEIGSSPLKGCEGNCMQAWWKVMATYRRVYDSRHLQADCQRPGSAPEPYARQSSMGYLYPFYW